ncbi:glycolipid transfer protein 3-like [Pistacia vera]|uniref:glycolipid transfer protein 3-like n=1 Tax=Pistacia vera TaxID=55513 RepID=UPI0012630E32|nr:glycolipid transfer protein 3-like [Pistacia vera]
MQISVEELGDIEAKMKRRREMEKGSEIRSAIEELSMTIKLKPNDNPDASSHVPTKPFLHVCNLVLQVLDKIGPTMLVLRQDIHQNVQRLEKLCEVNPSLYSNVVEMLKKEASEGNARKVSSCSRAFVWLTRSLDFTEALLQRLARNPEQKMEQAVEESYNITLKPWHGWISSAAFKVALKLVPDNITFINLLLAKDENYDTLKEEMQTLISLLGPFLEEIHSILRLHRLDMLKSP